MSRARDIADGTLNSADINGGNVDNTTIGGTTPAAGTFTTFTSTGIHDNAASTAVTIDSSGNVGLGTTSPGEKLTLGSGGSIGFERYGGADSSLSFASDNNTDFSIEARYTNFSGAVKQKISFVQEGSTARKGIAFYTTNGTNTADAGVERMRIDSSGNLKFDSGYGSAATAYGCRAWVNFDGTASMTAGSSYGPDAPPADYSTPNPIRASGNVSSITDNGGNGDYTVNFATAMPDANYSVAAINSAESSGFGSINIEYGTAPTSSGVTIKCIGYSTFYNPLYINIAVFR